MSVLAKATSMRIKTKLCRVCAITSLALIGMTAQAFDTKWHADATRIAMSGNGFSSDARLLTQFANYLTDFFSVIGFEGLYKNLPNGRPDGAPSGLYGIDMEDVARLHFDALTSTEQVEYQWTTLEANTKQALIKWNAESSVKPAFRAIVLMTILGASLHAVQDFYSHSNWLKQVKAPYPIWFEVSSEDRAKLSLRSGWYPDGDKPNVLYHKDENKDSSGRILNAEAFDAATRASNDWVKRIVAETPNLPWATLKAWKPEPENTNGPWLRNADATFLTTTSAVTGHWDGPTPVKNVFNPDPERNRNMAIQAFLLTAGVYKQNIQLSSPLTPTPHWVGFSMYHVEKDLARGLYLQNSKR